MCLGKTMAQISKGVLLLRKVVTERLEAARTDGKKLSQNDLAELVGMNSGNFSSLLAARPVKDRPRGVGLATALRMQEVFGIPATSWNELAEEESEPNGGAAA